MSDVTIKQLAKVLGLPVDRLLGQLAEAGMKFSDPEQVISSTEKVKLLGFLRRTHGKSEAEQEAARQLFMEKLEVDQEIANILVQEGFSSIEEIAYVPSAELLAVEGFDEDIVEELRARARDALLTEALAVEETIDEHQPSEELLELNGMDETTAYALAARGVVTVDDLADQAVDDLIDIEGMTEERAAALIMAARAPMIEQLEKGG